MATIIEHDVQHDSGIASAMTAIVAIAAILLVVGIAMYILQVYPFSERSLADSATTRTVNVNIDRPLPSSNPTAQ